MRTLIVILILFSFYFTAAATEAPKISSLSASEEVQVEYSSRGCFHHFAYFFEFKDKSVTIYELKQTWSEEKQKFISLGKKKLGTLQLSDEDVIGLDQLFRFYSTNAKSGCTTVDHIIAKHLQGGKIISSSEYYDGSCSTSDEEKLLTLSALKQRLAKDR